MNVDGGASRFGLGNGTQDPFVNDILGVLGRSWLCQPHPRDDRKGKVCVTELNQTLRQQAELEVGLELREFEGPFRKIWPRGAEDDWRKDWQSFALQDAGNGIDTQIEE